MSVRPAKLNELLHHLQAIFNEEQLSGDARELVQKAFQALASAPGAASEEVPRRLPLVEEWLEPALQLAGGGPASLGPLVAAFRAVEPQLHWHHRAGSKPGTAFHEGHANAMLIGPRGLEERSDVWLGLTLMRPELDYVRHQHPPEELYLVMTPGEWQQDDGPWFDPGVIGTVYNRPMIHHAMRSAETPFFTFWLLWNGAKESSS